MRVIYLFFLFLSHSLVAQDLGDYIDYSKKVGTADFSIFGVLDSVNSGEFTFQPKAVRTFAYSEKLHSRISKILISRTNDEAKSRAYVAIVKKFSVYDQKLGPYDYKGKVDVAIDFYSLYDGDTTLVYEGQGGGEFTYGNKNEAFKNIGGFCSQVTYSIAKRFNAYILSNKNSLIDFNAGSKVLIQPFRNDVIPDTVFYNLGEIRWDLFKGAPKKVSQFTASIFPGLAFNSSLELKDGYLLASIEPYVYMLPNMSWVKIGGNTAYALAHEQLHFDIAYLSCLKMLTKIKRVNTTSLKELQSYIQYEYLLAYQDMNRLQTNYDAETKHGLNVIKQKEWSNRIKREIESLD